MAYKPIKWKDHVVERPRTFTEIVNADGSKTLTPAPGTVIQQGTPLSASNFNSSEEALVHYAAALDMLACIVESMYMEMETMREQLSALTGSGTGVSGEETDGAPGRAS